MTAGRWLPIPAILALSAILGGCVSGGGDEAAVAAAREEAGLRARPVPMTRAEVEAYFVGATRVTSAFDRGSQVTYLAPDGTSHLWFPGNPVVVRGRWSIEATGDYRPYAGRPVESHALCFQYGGG